MSRSVLLSALIPILLSLAGCLPFTHDASRSYVTVVTDANHDADKARAECDRAAKSFENGQLAKAEAALQDALVADVSYAPAHNNLGRIYFDQGKLYLAAWEFEYARRLLPDSAEVASNLGMVYDAAGQTDQAIEHFRMASALDQNNSVYAGNLACALVRANSDPTRAAVLLQQVVLHDARPEWVHWARAQLELRQPIRAAAQASGAGRANQAEPETVEPLPRQSSIEDLPLPPMPDLPEAPDSSDTPTGTMRQ